MLQIDECMISDENTHSISRTVWVPWVPRLVASFYSTMYLYTLVFVGLGCSWHGFLVSEDRHNCYYPRGAERIVNQMTATEE